MCSDVAQVSVHVLVSSLLHSALDMPLEAHASSQGSPTQAQWPASSVPCAQSDAGASRACGALCYIDDLRIDHAGRLDETKWSNSHRNLERVEIFAGVGAVAAAASELNLRAATYDKNRIPGSTEATEDITSEHGFRTAVSLVMRLVPTGLLWIAPDCSSWGWMNASQCRRASSNGYEGDLSCAKVVTAMQS